MIETSYTLYCDRCKKEVAHSDLSYIIKIQKKFHIAKIKIIGSNHESEVCNDCYKSYFKWFREGGENAKDYKAEA